MVIGDRVTINLMKLTSNQDGQGPSPSSCNEAQKRTWAEASKSGKQTQEKLLGSGFADAGWEAQRILDAMDTAPDFYFHAIQQIKITKCSASRRYRPCLNTARRAGHFASHHRSLRPGRRTEQALWRWTSFKGARGLWKHLPPICREDAGYPLLCSSYCSSRDCMEEMGIPRPDEDDF